jgi:hypothetical protein
MINIEQFLLDNNSDGTYALVTYNNKTELTWFSKYYYKNEPWFLESPCELYKIMEVDRPIDEFSKWYVDGLLEENADVESYINKYVKPMIIDNVLYEIENFQCSPYLPKFVDDIKLISERECLEYLLKLIK